MEIATVASNDHKDEPPAEDSAPPISFFALVSFILIKIFINNKSIEYY